MKTTFYKIITFLLCFLLFTSCTDDSREKNLDNKIHNETAESNEYNQEVENNFMSACILNSNGNKEACKCMYEKIKSNLSFEKFKKLEKESKSPESIDFIRKMQIECIGIGSSSLIENQEQKSLNTEYILSDEPSLIRYLEGKSFHGTNIAIQINPTSIDVDGINRYFNLSFSVIGPHLGSIRGESLSNPDGVIYLSVNTRTGCIENDGISFCQ